MMTNPNTLGLYESAMPKLAQLVHEKGGLVYGDGANMNAVLGRARPGDVGVDVMQYNLHKTFTTPHGGGGPGSGPVAFKRHLGAVSADARRAPLKATCSSSIAIARDSVGRVRSFFGNFGMMVRAYTYIRELGAEGLRERERPGRAQRQLRRRAAARRTAARLRDADAARGRVHGSSARSRKPASRRSTSPSA